MAAGDDAHEAADAAARLRAWFEAEGPLVMDEADLDDVQTVLAENERMRAERDDAHRRFDALVHADKAKQGAADWMLNRLHDDHLINDGTYTSLCGLLRDQIDATRHLTHSEDWGPLTDRFRAAVKRTKDAEAETDQLRAELERYRGLDAAAKELLARNVELGTRAHNAKAKCEDLEDEVARLRKRLQRDPICGTYYPAAEAFTAAEARMQAAFEAGEGDDGV